MLLSHHNILIKACYHHTTWLNNAIFIIRISSMLSSYSRSDCHNILTELYLRWDKAAIYITFFGPIDKLNSVLRIVYTNKRFHNNRVLNKTPTILKLIDFSFSKIFLSSVGLYFTSRPFRYLFNSIYIFI